ncbi:MAG: pyruvate, phosphate dikinase [candidate division KSB1 bacterium]|nr:pyruvate, phosphate dikinase [candidate division KSB1 bacterium]MDZ7273281.1 pyruvate, phosphate dikinase [candidate division KSB1 bacterium]MDZ7285383.1 pyruvate, phosphate dikinase [candidate division KSB1 bacterium]MDZ7298415.1 pyruvate, phosphate dikinase [candidate division KSB1 bacterium]MDZ7307680.1 pyruvate, phosphate dikinase [candidate division KSB1 bacterium]
MKLKKLASKRNGQARNKYVYTFGAGKAEGDASMKNLLGGKGANLAEMASIGLPVPAGFTITTEVCTAFYQNNRRYPRGLEKQVEAALAQVEKIMGAKFGSRENPLLVSVRSGARVSMPGMMDTVLNLGLNDETVQGLIARTGNERFAYDCYRRFVQMYGDVVLGLKPQNKDDIDPFEEILHRKKEAQGVKFDNELGAAALRELVQEFKTAIKQRTGHDFPEDPRAQLWGAIGAVFGSWMNERAIAYRKLYEIPEDWGTAVNVQAMVFGNMGDDCGTGVAFTRDPATGENVFYGEYLINAQGEDVVAGIRTPQPIARLEQQMPGVYAQLLKIRRTLERHYKEMQDIEFTVQNGRLWMLQTRNGKRTAFAAFKIAHDMVAEKLIKKEDALVRLDPNALNQLLRPIFDAREKQAAIASGNLLAKGLNAGPGAAAGKIVFNAEDAVAWSKRGEKVILVRIETSPEDIKGMDAAEGILTARGGMTSHAALVARQMGKVCVAGCEALEIDYRSRTLQVRGRTLREGDWLSIDGTTGEVIAGAIKTRPSEILQVLLEKTMPPEQSETYRIYADIMAWADKYRKLNIRTNADQPDQAANAVAFGAEGIGLCRTEHMFFGGDRIDAVREMILADDEAGRRVALAKLLPFQRQDFIGLFEVMDGLPVTIRTLDPPLHEFLPHTEREQADLAAKLGVSAEKIKAKVAALHEFNPMLGHRGCRLGVVYPEITEMQARAIFEAACTVARQGKRVLPEIMIPLVGHVNELKAQAKIVRETAARVFAEQGIKVDYLVGTMIELPRAAVVADQIAQEAEFFSYGTNDLTQTTFGLSRDDAGKFLPYYIEHEILPSDPFETIDVEGVGELMKWGVQRGRNTRPKLKVGICGEHGGDPATVKFCHQIGLNYVSCSPFRVPIARLAAAQAALTEAEKD